MTDLSQANDFASELSRLTAQFSNDPLKLFENGRTVLRKACAQGGDCDANGSNAGEGHLAYINLANTFFNSGFPAAAFALLEEWWNDLGNRQRNERQRVYRAIAALHLTDLYRRGNDEGAAIWWALHTQADDILGNHEARGGVGKQYLRTIFGMSQSALEDFNGFGDLGRNAINNGTPTGDWSRRDGFAEDVVLQFAINHPEAMALFSHPTHVYEYPLSEGYSLGLWNGINRVGTLSQTSTKGTALEDLATYLLLLVPGLIPARNLLDDRLAFESDLVVRDLGGPVGVTSQLMGQDILIECKNWKVPVGVQQVGYFLYRMHLTHTRFGIIFSKKGITGSKDDKAAHDLIRKAFHEDGDVCIVVNSVDIDALITRQTTIRALLLGRSQRAMFGSPR